MGKTNERMRANPRADWQIADVEKACCEAGVICMKPAGGSHDKVGNPHGGRRFTIPARRPIKAVYCEAGAIPRRGGCLMVDRSKLIVADGSLFDPALYEVILRPLAIVEGGGWLATIPPLPGCTGDGDSEMDAIEDVRMAALEWAHAAISDGDPVPAPQASSIAAE
jgi:predicted RNase H-like HicB family nuclease